MLAYAADQRPQGRSKSPTSLALIIGGHALALALVLSARMELTTTDRTPPTKVIDITNPPPPAPPPDPQPRPNQPVESTVFVPQPPIPLPPQPGPTFEPGPPIDRDPIASGPGPAIVPQPELPIREIVRSGPRFATPDHALRPPYPMAKVRNEEEATLRLRLTIDANGRVTAVDPIGKNDATFLEAARKHILKAWRYKPALEDGTAVASTTVISLAFRLEDA